MPPLHPHPTPPPNSNSTVIYHSLFYFREARKTLAFLVRLVLSYVPSFREDWKTLDILISHRSVFEIVIGHEVTPLIDDLLLSVELPHLCFKRTLPFWKEQTNKRPTILISVRHSTKISTPPSVWQYNQIRDVIKKLISKLRFASVLKRVFLWNHSFENVFYLTFSQMSRQNHDSWVISPWPRDKRSSSVLTEQRAGNWLGLCD